MTLWTDEQADAFLERITQPGPVDPPYDGPEPDPPHGSDAESDRAADRYEAWLDQIGEREC